ncbi:MAG: T9SS type A sorting domain-containing protein [Candidatus Neomarinimicrobiota bacterium]
MTRSNVNLLTLSDIARFEVENQLLSFYHQSQSMSDGWSLLRYDEGNNGITSPLYRSQYPATQDSISYWEVVGNLLHSDRGIIGIGHLRVATSGSTSIPNPHPWMFNHNNLSYSLIHNGTVNKELLYDLITDNETDLSWLESHPPQTFDGGDWRSMGWGNVVDSELILLFIMKRIQNAQNVFDGYVTAILDLVNAGINANQLNMVFSDGLSLIIFGGDNGLYIKDSEEYFSVMTQPPMDENLDWDGITHQELVMVNQDSLIRYPDFVSNNIQESRIIPSYFNMSPAYPNPFNGSVYFSLDGLSSADIDISIFSIIGKKIDQFNLSGPMSGRIEIGWTPPNNLSSGTYFIEAGFKGNKQTQKILFIK